MKLKSLLYSVLFSAAFFATSCTENEPEYTPAPPADSPEVFFSVTETNSTEVGETDTEFSVTVYRSDDAQAATYPITCTVNQDAQLFTLPESVSFEAGEATAQVTVEFEVTKLEGLVPYEITFVVGDGENTPYALRTFVYTLTYFPWNDVVGPNGEEFGTWTEDFLTTAYNLSAEALTFPVKIQSSPAIKGLYRIVNPYEQAISLFGESPYAPGQLSYFYINASDPNCVYMCNSEGSPVESNGSPVYYYFGYNLGGSVGEPFVTGYFNYSYAQGASIAECAQYAGSFANGVLKFATPKSFIFGGSNLGTSLYYSNLDGNFKILWPGAVEESPADWENIGAAEFTDGWITPLYSGGTPETWTVEVEQSVKDPNIYRLVNPYKDGIMTDGAVYSGDKYFVFDATNPNLVIVEAQNVWNEPDPNFGDIYATNYGYALQNLMSEPYTPEWILENGYNDTFANQTFTFPGGHCIFLLPDTQNSNYKNKLLSSTNKTTQIVLSQGASAQAAANVQAAASKGFKKVSYPEIKRFNAFLRGSKLAVK